MSSIMFRCSAEIAYSVRARVPFLVLSLALSIEIPAPHPFDTRRTIQSAKACNDAITDIVEWQTVPNQRAQKQRSTQIHRMNCLRFVVALFILFSIKIGR